MSTIDPERVANALRATHGNINRAAMVLGTHEKCVRNVIDRSPEAWPDGVVRRGRGRPAGTRTSPTPLPYRLTPRTEAVETRERVVAGAIRRSGGVVTAAAKMLRMTPGGLGAYLEHHPLAWPEGVVSNAPSSRRKVTP